MCIDRLSCLALAPTAVPQHQPPPPPRHSEWRHTVLGPGTWATGRSGRADSGQRKWAPAHLTVERSRISVTVLLTCYLRMRYAQSPVGTAMRIRRDARRMRSDAVRVSRPTPDVYYRLQTPYTRPQSLRHTSELSDLGRLGDNRGGQRDKNTRPTPRACKSKSGAGAWGRPLPPHGAGGHVVGRGSRAIPARPAPRAHQHLEAADLSRGAAGGARDELGDGCSSSSSPPPRLGEGIGTRALSSCSLVAGGGMDSVALTYV